MGDILSVLRGSQIDRCFPCLKEKEKKNRTLETWVGLDAPDEVIVCFGFTTQLFWMLWQVATAACVRGVFCSILWLQVADLIKNRYEILSCILKFFLSYILTQIPLKCNYDNLSFIYFTHKLITKMRCTNRL